MASSDVRDVLNLPQDGAVPRPIKKSKAGAYRGNLKGLAREVQNLGGDNPIAIVPEVAVFKKRRFAGRKPAARWEMRPFQNSARQDLSLILRHWRRQQLEAPPVADVTMEDGGEAQVDGEEPQAEDSAFAKFNVAVDVPQFSVDEYNSKLQNPDWSKGETDYLLQTVKDFDLRWPLIWDRYDYQPSPPAETVADGDSTAIALIPKSRSMEDLKARYYEVAAKMMAVQKPVQYMTDSEYTLHEIMANFNPQQEKMRKDFAISSMGRTDEEVREEENLLYEVKRILARSERTAEERRELYLRLDYPHTEQDIGAFKSSAGLQNLLQTLMSVDKSKKRKSLLSQDGVSPAGAGPSGQPTSAGPDGRRESIAASASGHRDSIGGGDKTPVEPPAKNNKKGQAHSERRKLTEQEEQVFGVSHHDRLGSGVAFRCEKVNKLFTTKSGQQQQRITNALNELDIPSRLTMPTAAVASQFEQLVIAVTQLVDLRKLADKMEQEIKIEEAKKVERDRAKGILPPANATTDEPAKEGRTAASVPAADDAGAALAASSGSLGPTAAIESAAIQLEANTTEANDAVSIKNPSTSLPPVQSTQPTESGANGEASTDGVQIKKEEPDRDKLARPSSSGAHKRSASVLSTTSEKSTKRQKK